MIRDFDFLFGCWTVAHRRLRNRGVGSHQWEEFSGTAETRPLLDGLCNIEEHRIGGCHFSGIALRAFDPQSALWSIYWVSERDGRLQAPVIGAFDGDVGRFTGSDMDGDRPVQLRFVWNRSDPGAPNWRQCFSYDNGSSWELNWVMDFRPAS